jgi:hypothetical protein
MKLWQLLVVIAAIIVAVIWATGGFSTKALIVQAPVNPIVQPAIVVAPPVSAPVVEPKKISDINVKRFSDLGEFIIDGDPLTVNFKVKGAQMTYECTQGYGVFISSMDPGVVQGYNTGKFGAVAYIVCPKGNTVKIQTPHWSLSALHNQIHLVELKGELPTEKLIEVLKILKIDEGKEIALFIDANQKVTVY